MHEGTAMAVVPEVENALKIFLIAADRVVAQTAGGTKLRFNLFVSYGARAEIVRAVRQLASDAAAGRLDPATIDDAVFESRLFTAGCPDPDLLIRTSGEQRLSNFLLWQLAYTELYISPLLWPNFGVAEFYGALLDYQQRDRRFGRVHA